MDDASEAQWSLIESDPGVFTEMLERLGVKEVVVEEVYDLGPDSFKVLQANSEIYGFVFLFKISRTEDSFIRANSTSFSSNNLLFIKQIARNACATQALLSVILNNEKIELGDTLNTVKEFITSNYSPEIAGFLVSSNEFVRSVHNSFAPPTSPFEYVTPAGRKADSFHYVGYIFHSGNVVELDGLQKSAMTVGVCTEQNWMNVMRDAILKKIERLQEKNESHSEIRFNLLAVVSDPITNAKKQLEHDRHLAHRLSLKKIILGEEAWIDTELDEESAPDDVIAFDDLPSDLASINEMLDDSRHRVDGLKKLIAAEEVKREKWRKENIRRRHDFIPLFLCIMRHLARRRELRTALMNSTRAHAQTKAPVEKRDPSL